MQRISDLMRDKAREMLHSGAVDRVLGWKAGELYCDPSPSYFDSGEQLGELVYDSFCGGNLSKYLISGKSLSGKVLAFLKPCDTYSFNQLLCEHRVDRDKVYVVGVGCSGKLDGEKIRNQGIKGIQSFGEAGEEISFQTFYGEKRCGRQSLLLEKCLSCKGKEHVAFDELLGADESVPAGGALHRFAGVAEVEEMDPGERYSFWRGELSKCIRCNACRNACPACSCIQCVFDNADSGIGAKANTDTFEENLFHIIRAFHVAGRCTDCGECSRVCPQGIPLHLLNRKLIKDINTLYGTYQAGSGEDVLSPLTAYTLEDAEPEVVAKGGIH